MKAVFTPTEEFFARIPTQPGVYIMKAGSGDVIYVGKAKHLRNRVRQYFRPGDDTRFFIASGLLGRHLKEVETLVVDNEKEALLLENLLIKKHQPRFNVKLRDDKQYLVLRIDLKKEYPRVEVVRNINNDGARYFGPYHSATSCRETLRTLNRFFKLRTCTDHVLKTRKRPCLQYQIKRCPGPCVFPVDAKEYQEQVDDAMMFLNGKSNELVSRLKNRMWEQSQSQEFEAAAQVRDSIAAVERSISSQRIVQDGFVDQDVFGLYRRGDVVELIVLFVRGGKLVGKRAFKQREQQFPDALVLSNFVQQYYATGTFIPDEVVVPVALELETVLVSWLSSLRGKKVKIIAAQRGARNKLLDLAKKNAEASFNSRQNQEADRREMLSKVQKRLGLRKLPIRIECYDIAHIQGTNTVASMVTFVDGLPDKSLYRKFRVRNASNDDFASMHEVITRRLKRAVDAEPGSPWELPDLFVIDGGKGQLGSAVAAAQDMGFPDTGEKSLDIVALAKERDDVRGNIKPDRVFPKGVKDPISLRSNSAELFLLARLRDEAHRFANTFHKDRRRKSSLRSALDNIPGVGPTRRKVLLTTFGSVAGVKKASVDELAAAKGMNRKTAQAVFDFFQENK